MGRIFRSRALPHGLIQGSGFRFPVFGCWFRVWRWGICPGYAPFRTGFRFPGPGFCFSVPGVGVRDRAHVQVNAPLVPQVNRRAQISAFVVAPCSLCDSSFAFQDYNTYMAHPWSPFPLRRAYPGPGPHMSGRLARCGVSFHA